MYVGGDSHGLGEGSIIDGKYRLAKKLSEGGGGVVWLSTDIHGNDIALKTLKWSPLKSKELATERFKNEFAIFKTLSHPNIARIFDFGYDPSHHIYYFTSELLQGGDLRTFKCRPIEEIEPLLLQALRSLEYLRNSGLLHLDIKPQNFLLRKDEKSHNLVLIDFGLATFRPPDMPGGTPNYMPPEIVVRRLPDEAHGVTYPSPDHRSDLYSLGVTFYYILTGIQPFYVRDAKTGRIDVGATLHKHVDRDEILPPSHHRNDIPAYLDTIIMKLMAQHPDDRYPAAAIAAQALRYRSPRELEPESLESLLSYLPKQGKVIGRKSEIQHVESAITNVAEHAPHAKPILCLAGPRGCGRTRILEFIKPLAQRLEMDVRLINAQQSTVDELTQLSLADEIQPRPHVILVDDLDTLLIDGAPSTDASALLNPLCELIQRARRTQRLSQPTAPPMFIAFAINTDHVPLPRALKLLDIDEEMLTAIELKNFTVDEVREYLTSLLGEEIPYEAALNLHKVTQGNPLIITEQLERMISDGMLFSFAGRPDASTLEAIGLDFEHLPPAQSLKESTISHFEKLNLRERELASLMACWNQPVTLEDLHHTAEIEDIEAALVNLISTDLVHRIQDDDGRYTFTNPMAAIIIEKHLLEKERAALHSSIASHLERHAGDRVRIDHHRANGSDKSMRLRALERLAKEAEEQRRHHEATEDLEALLKEVSPSDWDMNADVLIRLGRAYEWAYMPKHSHDAFKHLMDLGAPDDKQRIFKVRALEQLALSAVRRRELDNARDYLSQALHLLGRGREDLPRRLRLENFLAGIDLRDGNPDEAVRHFEMTLKLAEKLPSTVIGSLSNNELGEALLQAERPDEAEEILIKELSEAETSGEIERVCSRHYLLGNVYSSPKKANYDEALNHYGKAFEIARQHRLLRMQVRLYNSMGNLMLDVGKLDKAIDQYRKGLALSEQIDSKTTSVELMVGLGLAHARQHDIDTAIEYFEAALDFASGPMGGSAGLIKRFEPTIYVHLGDAYYRKKLYDRAMTFLEKAERIDHEQKLSDEIRYSIYGTYAEIFVDKGEPEKAKKYLPILKKIVEHFTIARDHLTQLENKLH